MTHRKHTSTQSGFALLITILVLSVVVAVTLAIVELSLKQLKLSVDSTDSEIAFHAANAGLECARYIRRVHSDDFETGADVDIDCFGSSPTASDLYSNDFATAGTDFAVYRYNAEIDWGAVPSERCTTMDIVAIVATSTVTIGSAGNPLFDEINGYETEDKVCNAGERCTIMSVVGYSSSCGNITNSGVLKREILLEL